MKSREEKGMADSGGGGGDEEGDEGVAVVSFEDRLARIRQSKNQEKVGGVIGFKSLNGVFRLQHSSRLSRTRSSRKMSSRLQALISLSL